MKKNDLGLNTHRTGLLIDGVGDTPYVVGTLTHKNKGRVECSIPFVRYPTAQFTSANRWFDMHNGTLPKNLLFEDERGSVSLFGVTTQFASLGTGVSLGKFSASSIVFAGTEGALDEEFRVQKLRTKMDGLTDWVAAEAISVRSIADDEGRLTGLDVSVKSPEEIRWSSGEAKMTLDVHWNWTGGRELKVAEYVLLRSEFVDGKAKPTEHLEQHRMVRALLVISSGGTIAYREHWIMDEHFPLRMLNGDHVDIPWQSAIFSQTVREHYAETPRDDHMLRSMVTFNHLGSTGMEAWAAVYKRWRRPVDVLFGLLSEPARFIEDRLLASSMAIEATGHLIGPVANEAPYKGRNVPFSNQVYRCLHIAGFDPEGIAASEKAFAIAAANIYRRIKHPEHEMPDSMHSWLISHVLEVVARAVLIGQIPNAQHAVESFMSYTAAPKLSDSFRRNNLFIDSGGEFVSPSQIASTPARPPHKTPDL